MIIRLYTEEDLPALCKIFNEIVDEGKAFPETERLSQIAGSEFFARQTATCVATKGRSILGFSILHPNNVGRCGHVANASYAVSRDHRGQGVGKLLVRDSLKRCRDYDFRGLQFNAVVDSNKGARELYERLGFVHIGTIPGGFYMPDGSFEDTHIYYHDLS